MFISIGGKGHDARFLVPVKDSSYGFFPIESEDELSASPGRLLELVVLSDSGDCPDVSLRHADGHFHTGDLFTEVEPGKYIYRGRNDDWIKTVGRCDTK